MRGKKKTKKTRANDRILHLTYGISLSYWILYILYNKRRLLSLFNSLIHSVLLTRYRFKSVSNLHIYNDLACRIIHPPRLGSAAKHGGGSIALSVTFGSWSVLHPGSVAVRSAPDFFTFLARLFWNVFIVMDLSAALLPEPNRPRSHSSQPNTQCREVYRTALENS